MAWVLLCLVADRDVLRPRGREPADVLVAVGEVEQRADRRIELVARLELRARLGVLAVGDQPLGGDEQRLGRRGVVGARDAAGAGAEPGDDRAGEHARDPVAAHYCAFTLARWRLPTVPRAFRVALRFAIAATRVFIAGFAALRGVMPKSRSIGFDWP